MHIKTANLIMFRLPEQSVVKLNGYIMRQLRLFQLTMKTMMNFFNKTLKVFIHKKHLCTLFAKLFNSITLTQSLCGDLFLKQLRNYKRKLFLCPPQKQAKTQPTFLKLLFFTINVHFITLKQISTYRKLNLPLTSSIYFVFLLLEMQKRHKLTKVYYALSYFV